MDRRYPPPLPLSALAARWREAWAALPRAVASQAAVHDGEPLYAALVAAWSEPWRHYHDRRHLGECLAHLQRWRAGAARPDEVAVALWFHDAVYRPLARHNEAASADWAARAMTASGVEPAAVARVRALVMATAHLGGDATAAEPASLADADWRRDRDLVLDIDLAVLGSPAGRYADYEADVRREYRALPMFLYRRGRRRVLQQFADGGPLYRTAPAQAAYEDAARRNLAAALARLGGRGAGRVPGGAR